jgi:hypothetical protein
VAGMNENAIRFDSIDDLFGSAPGKPRNNIKDLQKSLNTRRGTSSKPVIPDYDSDHIKYHFDIVQGSDEWAELRRGILTASEMKHIITPNLKVASNDKERKHVHEIAAQRITQYVEPSYYSDDMLRGHDDEIDARELYSEHYEPVRECGFVTNDSLGFTIGFSPDGLVRDVGLIEVKSKKQYLQLMRILKGTTDPDHIIQMQTGLWATGREWLDSITYCGGMKMITLRVYPDPIIQGAIVEAARAFEERVQMCIDNYDLAVNSGMRLIDTERRVEQDIIC